jgi:hypothetical protein
VSIDDNYATSALLRSNRPDCKRSNLNLMQIQLEAAPIFKPEKQSRSTAPSSPDRAARSEKAVVRWLYKEGSCQFAPLAPQVARVGAWLQGEYQGGLS